MTVTPTLRDSCLVPTDPHRGPTYRIYIGAGGGGDSSKASVCLTGPTSYTIWRRRGTIHEHVYLWHATAATQFRRSHWNWNLLLLSFESSLLTRISSYRRLIGHFTFFNVYIRLEDDLGISRVNSSGRRTKTTRSLAAQGHYNVEIRRVIHDGKYCRLLFILHRKQTHDKRTKIHARSTCCSSAGALSGQKMMMGISVM